MKTSIEEIQELVFKLGKRIGAPKSLLIIRDSPSYDGSPYVELNDKRFSLISSERGFEISREETESLDELLYWIIIGVAKCMAVDYELDNRQLGQDTRRIYFSRLIDLMEAVDTAWGERAKREIDQILEQSPYRDDVAPL